MESISWSHSSSIKHLGDYNVKTNLLVSVAVNKSAFILLADTYGNVNKTIDVKAFHSTNFPIQGSGSTEGQTFQSNMELNHMYQLKIGNYETFISNQTNPLTFTIQNTNRTLDILIGAESFTTDSFSLQTTSSFLPSPDNPMSTWYWVFC